MPYAVTHVILTIVLLDIIRDYIVKDRKKIPLHCIFIGGGSRVIAGYRYPIVLAVKQDIRH